MSDTVSIPGWTRTQRAHERRASARELAWTRGGRTGKGREGNGPAKEDVSEFQRGAEMMPGRRASQEASMALARGRPLVLAVTSWFPRLRRRRTKVKLTVLEHDAEGLLDHELRVEDDQPEADGEDVVAGPALEEGADGGEGGLVRLCGRRLRVDGRGGGEAGAGGGRGGGGRGAGAGDTRVGGRWPARLAGRG